MNVLERCSQAPVACERSDRVQLPPSTRQIRQAEMPQRVRAEARDASSYGDAPDHLRPRPGGDRSGAIPMRLREEQRTPCQTHGAPFLEIRSKQFARGG